MLNMYLELVITDSQVAHCRSDMLDRHSIIKRNLWCGGSSQFNRLDYSKKSIRSIDNRTSLMNGRLPANLYVNEVKSFGSSQGSYKWTTLYCGHCDQHLGWKFQASKLIPQLFFGLTRKSLRWQIQNSCDNI